MILCRESSRAATVSERARRWLGCLYVAAADGDRDLELRYTTVAGNPLAILLVIGQIQRHGLDRVVDDLRLRLG